MSAGSGKGQSPHTRENSHADDDSQHPRGSIPAHAGEPSWSRASSAPSRVNPRTRGGTLTACAEGTPTWGQSPHTRGNRPVHRGTGRLRGSIPAHAGEPSSRRGRRGCRRVNPRTRGGTHQKSPEQHRKEGQSPHTRGNPRHPRILKHPRRSIPAHAGEPALPGDDAGSYGVNPRTRGGTGRPSRPDQKAAGQSPHTRGNR